MPKFENLKTLPGADYLVAVDRPNLPAIRAAADVFTVRVPRADLAEYKISVCREGELLHVIFVDKERSQGMRGSGGRPNCPGFEVTLQGRIWSSSRRTSSGEWLARLDLVSVGEALASQCGSSGAYLQEKLLQSGLIEYRKDTKRGANGCACTQ